MQVELNTVWSITGLDGVQCGVYRLLKIYVNDELIILFPLNNEKGIKRPFCVPLSLFLEGLKREACCLSEFEVPAYLSYSDQSIPEEHLNIRNENYQLIKELILSPFFLKDICTQQRSRVISQHARKNNTYVQRIYRTLNLYWKFGQEINALLPAYKLSGGSGQQRIAGQRKRGRPIRLSTPSLSVSQGVNTTEADKDIFIKAMKKFGMTGNARSYSWVYDQMLKEYYAEELIAADNDTRQPEVPNYRNFIYWTKKLVPENELIRRQTNKGDFERNKRGLRGAATDHTEVPGSCFELDATVLDVHIVSEYQRNHVLGRPTLYIVVDKESRMIVGLHVSMEYASWRAGRQALVNSFTSKKEYCRIFGIDIEEREWPCHHLPQRLLCDRGEFICDNAENKAVPLIGHLSIAPPYRADLKAIVERYFRELNEKLIHQLMGTTNGRHYIRGDKDPRMDAVLTLKEVTKLLIDAILDHNSSVLETLAGQTTLLIESDTKPNPLNYWNIHLQKHRHSLIKANEADVRARLLPPVSVTMTSKGLRRNNEMYYECDREEFEAWKVIARNSGSWPLEARFDYDNSSIIYVRFNKNEGFTRCQLMKRSFIFNQRHIADVVFFEDWKKIQVKNNNPDKKSLERHNRKKETIKKAKAAAKEAEPLSTKKEKVSGIKQRRNNVIKDARANAECVEPFKEETNSVEITSSHRKDKRNKVISMLKRQKSDRK